MGRTGTSNIVQRMEDGTLFYTGEIPVGSINDSNTTFTLANSPKPAGSLEVTLNGAELMVNEDYTISGDTLTLLIAPPTGSLLKVDYRVEP